MNEEWLTIIMAAKAEAISVDSLLSVLGNMVDILQDVEASTAQTARPKTEWQIVHAALNSPLNVAIGPAQDADYITRRAINAAVAGMRQIEDGANMIPPHFTYHTLERAKKLVAVLNDGVARLLLVPPDGESLVLTQHTAAHVDKLLPSPHDEIGSFEGPLETLSIHKTKRFVIWDEVTGARIECHVPDELLKAAHAAFGKRVSVSGRIRYSWDGRPESMKVTDLYEFPDKSQLPQFSDIANLKLAIP